MEPIFKIPNLVASTIDIYCCSIAESRRREERLRDAEFVANELNGPLSEETQREKTLRDAESEATEHDSSTLDTSSPPRQEVKPRDTDQVPKAPSEASRRNYASSTKLKAADSESNYFKSAQWTPDGTSLLTSSADNIIRTFILPPTLLSSPSSITLTPYTSHTHPTPINCLAPYPQFSLQDPTTTIYLSTPTFLPIRLLNILSPTSSPLSTYILVSPTTEAYLTPSSILWSSPGTHFLTGTDCLISLFDISLSGSGPITRMPTIPSKRHKMKGGGVGMRGIVSALSLQPERDVGASGNAMLAAGTWTRWIGLYDMGGMGGTVGTWSVATAADSDAGIGGSGVTQTAWSSDGRYLYVVERKSKGVLVYDVRVTGKLVCWLEGRDADTNQRLGVDIFEGERGMEVWAGGMDGVVRVWEGVGMTEGKVEKSWEWKAHDDAVSSTMVHNSGTVVATCSGQRSEPALFNDSDSDSDSESDDDYSGQLKTSQDNSIKVWSL